MAKKSRRARRQPTTGAQPVRVTKSAQSAEATPVAQPVRVARPIRPPAAQAPKQVDFSKEYHYVISDLKLTFLIAGVLLVVMIGLAFIIG